MSQAEPVGNTNPTDSKKPPQSNNQLYRWQFTLKFEKDEPVEPNITDGAKELFELLTPFCKEFYFQLEKGGKTDYYHFQGCMSLRVKHRMSEVKNIIRADVHVEPCRNWYALKKYNTKGETHVAGPWSHKTRWINLPSELFPWQKDVIDIVSKPCTDDRIIHWWWDEKGCRGKTILCKILVARYGADLIDGGFKDIAYSLSDEPKIVVMNITRSVEGRVNYKALEAVKDGLLFSPKYESRVKIFNSPHVMVFANFAPEREAMSQDRWHVIRM